MAFSFFVKKNRYQFLGLITVFKKVGKI